MKELKEKRVRSGLKYAVKSIDNHSIRVYELENKEEVYIDHCIGVGFECYYFRSQGGLAINILDISDCRSWKAAEKKLSEYQNLIALIISNCKNGGKSLYLDDLRNSPVLFDFVARNVKQAIAFCNTENVEFVSFDHDLGEDELTGYDLACYFEELAHLGKAVPEYFIHSANPVGSKRIEAAMQSAALRLQERLRWTT